MNYIKIYFLFFVIFHLIFVFLGCGSIGRSASCCLFSQPDIYITPEKTVIERQIVGDYRELEKDAWIISSVKSNIQKQKGMSASRIGDKKLLKAMKIRELHETKIRSYKQEGAIGEKNDGFIIYKRHRKYERSKNSKDILSIVIHEENKARKTIFDRIL